MRLILLFLLVISLSDARARDFYGEDELRLELSDVKHALHSARIEITLLEERIGRQERLISSLKSAPASNIESKLSSLEKMLDKATLDLRHLNGQTTTALSKLQELELLCASHEKKFTDLGNLKGTLTSISKAIGQPVKEDAKVYIVKTGDSLEKIARVHHTSVEKIKQRNGLTKDTILPGQEIKIE